MGYLIEGTVANINAELGSQYKTIFFNPETYDATIEVDIPFLMGHDPTSPRIGNVEVVRFTQEQIKFQAFLFDPEQYEGSPMAAHIRAIAAGYNKEISAGVSMPCAEEFQRKKKRTNFSFDETEDELIARFDWYETDTQSHLDLKKWSIYEISSVGKAAFSVARIESVKEVNRQPVQTT